MPQEKYQSTPKRNTLFLLLKKNPLTAILIAEFSFGKHKDAFMKISDLPVGDFPPALPVPHFPARYQAVIWRNWNRVHPARLAEVLETSEEKIVESGKLLGLTRDDSNLANYLDRGFLTTIRFNWQLLNYEQLLQLLGWTPERMEFTLLEDDFLFIKLSKFKPNCEKVVYRELTEAEKKATAIIAAETAEIEARMPRIKEAPFSFLGKIGQKKSSPVSNQKNLRMIFSYSAVYGDSLLPESPDPYPEALLRDYAASGVNAVWLPAILYQLVPYLGEDMPLSTRCQERIAKLKTIAARAKKYGISIFLYLNEPRGIPARIKLKHESWRGPMQIATTSRSFCPWAEGMLPNLSDGIEKLCRAVPDLGGFFTITQSENLTHCLSRDLGDSYESPSPEMDGTCPACAKHSKAENIAAIMTAINNGIQRSGANMRLISYTWAWSKQWDRELLEMLPKNVEIMSVSETGVESVLHGIHGFVHDYAISKAGPGEQAKRMWRLASETGHPIVAKIQANTSWEMGGVPAIPVPTLVEEHLKNLRAIGVNDFMLSWTHGGYPGDNLELLDHSAQELAERDFGKECGPEVFAVWQSFGEAFRKIPFNDVYQIYFSPQNIGPANLLYPEKTNLEAGMVCGLPYDDLKTWSGNWHYPAQVMEDLFNEASTEWGAALEKLLSVGDRLAPEYRANYLELWSRAEATYTILRSTYCQIAFIRLRDAGKLDATKAIIDEEAELAQRLLNCQSSDSRIGFEAANQYYFAENELKEKIIACKYLKRQLFGE